MNIKGNDWFAFFGEGESIFARCPLDFHKTLLLSFCGIDLNIIKYILIKVYEENFLKKGENFEQYDV